MPGLTGIVGSGANIARVRAATAALRHFESYRSREIEIGGGAALGQVWRERNRSEQEWAVVRDARDCGTSGGAGVAVMLNGTVFSRGSWPRRVGAREVLDEYLRTDVLDPLAYDGAFVIALADERRGTVTVWNDRLGTLPVYYMESDVGVAFAPEPKALFAACGTEPRLSRTGIVSFLSCGYCLGKTTLYEGVQCLEPGSALEISMPSGRCRARRYWKIVYTPSRSLRRRRDAEAALHDATRAAHELVASDSMRGHDILLSGGWDSRGVLAFLDSIGRLPSAAVAWGRTKEIPDSDPYLAERLAERFGLTFKFIGYDSDQLLGNAHEWCRLSELANDNTGWFAEGASLLARGYSTDADFIVVGDEAWGWHGLPRTEHDARAANLPPSLSPEVAACLASGVRDECAAGYAAEIEHVLEPCANDHPIDRRDFLYLHGRVARFIFSLGYYKELSAEIRRPFLLAGVLEVMQQVPRRFRIDKNLYISMLARYFPALAAFPQRRARSLPEWSRDIRMKPELRRFFLDLLDERRLDGELGAVLDDAALARLKAAFFNQPVGEPPVSSDWRVMSEVPTSTGPLASGPRPSSRPVPSVTSAPLSTHGSAASVMSSSSSSSSASASTERSVHWVRGPSARELPLRFKQRIRAAGLHPGSRSMEGAYPSRGPADVIRCVAFLSLLQSTLRTRAPARAERAS